MAKGDHPPIPGPHGPDLTKLSTPPEQGIDRIEFTVRGLQFVGGRHGVSLAIYKAPNEGNREPCLASIKPPGTVEWTPQALEKWAASFLNIVAEARQRDENMDAYLHQECECGHQRQVHRDDGCYYSFGADQAVCSCQGFTPKSGCF